MTIGPMDPETLNSACDLPGAMAPKPAQLDEFLQRMRTVSDIDCLVGGRFAGDRRMLTGCRAALDPKRPASMAQDLMSWLARRMAVFHRLQEEVDEGGPGSGATARRFPIWIRDGRYLLGIGQAADRTYPVIACADPHPDRQERLKELLGLALVYLAQSTERIEEPPMLRAEDAAFATMKLLSIGCFVVNARGHILYDGRPAGQDDAGPWLVQSGRLATREERDGPALRKAVAEATQAGPRSSIITLTNTDGQKADMVVVTPLSTPGYGRLALVLFDTGRTDHRALRAQFFKAHDLTRSESLVAHQVLEGCTLNEMAEATGLSVATVRSYLKQVMAKTGTHRQSELVSLYYSRILPVSGTVVKLAPDSKSQA